jgi:AcrR family transcriptional regulator
MSNDTKIKILLATIELVEESGFEMVTLREVCRKSKQNLATVSYYFGNKEGLLKAIEEGYYVDLAKFWEKRYAELESTYGPDIRPRHLIHAFLEPFVKVKSLGMSRKLGRTLYVKMLMSNHQDNLFKITPNTTFGRVMTKYVEAMRRVVPSLSEREVLRIYKLSLGSAMAFISLARYENSLCALDSAADQIVDIEFEFVCDYCAAFVQKEALSQVPCKLQHRCK